MTKRTIRYSKGEIGKMRAVKDFLPAPNKLRHAKRRVRRMRLSHPGLTVLHDCLEPLGLSVTEGAKVLGVTRQALNNLVNGKSGISPEMAIRLEKAFGSSARVWLGSQMDYDLAQVMKKERAIKGEVRRAFAGELVRRTAENTERPERKRRAGGRVAATA